MVYRGILKSHSLEKRIFILVACGILLYLEFARGQYFYVPLTLLLVLAVFHRKEHLVSEEGVDIKYSLFSMTTTNRWTWDQITAVQPDYIKERPNARLLFEKDASIRSFLFSPEDCAAVLDLASKMNPQAYVENCTKQEQMAEEKRRQQERQRQQKAKAKKKRK